VRLHYLMTVAACAVAVASTSGLIGTCVAHYGIGFKIAPETTAEHAPAAEVPPTGEAAPRVRLANSGGSGPFSFLESLFGLGPQGAPRRSRPPEYRRPTPAPSEHSPPAGTGGNVGGTYRTMCVRLCDGYYWPASFATVKEHFGHDARACAKSCSAPVALYHYPNPGGAIEDMVSLDGQPYKSLGTAFLYRATYDPSCKCRAHPWEEAAIERHKGYAKSRETRAAARGGRRGR
jgi:hypothetical protein